MPFIIRDDSKKRSDTYVWLELDVDGRLLLHGQREGDNRPQTILTIDSEGLFRWRGNFTGFGFAVDATEARSSRIIDKT